MKGFTKMSNYVDRVLSGLQQTNGHEKEFLQSVTEVLGSLSKMLEAQPKYEKHKILERMVVPERAIIFQVPWVDDKGGIQSTPVTASSSTARSVPTRAGCASIRRSICRF